MKVSESWLREWVNTPVAGAELAAQLTMAGLEVDEISPASGDFKQVVVGFVRTARPHPEANKLTICEVDAGFDAPLQIVCGASNVRANLKVALAIPGASLPGGMSIQKTELRGELSEGMICSSVELGLEATSDGILELPDDAPVGQAIEHYLKLNDQILTVELTPNRADCFSMRGIAREVAALNQCALNTPEVAVQNSSIDDVCSVIIHAEDACPGYAVRLIRGVDRTAVTPLWMKERLRRAGIRSLNPVVDVTQYVMLEFGQPMHAFDAQKISGHVQVRMSQAGEKLTLLDGQEITLEAGVLLIADEHKPLAMAGIMGGSDSAVNGDTTDILLESAYFTPELIAGVARTYGLCTDASQRFERGVDPALHPLMLERATALLLDISGGNAGPVTWVHTKNYLPTVTIAFNPARVQSLTGLVVSKARMQSMLEALGMTVDAPEDAQWHVSVPSYRFDLRLDVDLVEEIARLHGYGNLRPEPTVGALQAGTISPFHRQSRAVSRVLCARGYHEVITYSFVDPAVQEVFYPDVATKTLVNPLSSELASMRVGLWPGLISALLRNASRQQGAMKCFETGVVFDMQGEQLKERAMLAGLMTGETGSLNWSEPTRVYDFYDLKGTVEALFADITGAGKLTFSPEALSALHPGKSARIMLGERAVGWMGALHPALAEVFGLDTEVLLFEIKLDAFEATQTPLYRAISKYPQVQRDLSLLVDQTISASQIETVVRRKSAELLKAFHVFDHYTGTSIPENKKSLGIALILQDEHRTLTEQDITPLMENVMAALESELGIHVRDGV
ncbi:MAG: phenylalanine--tRNA ligase subunit beta [Legionella sp.]|jgi:phenylalanyl-tRNA synthetase beta chain|nr:phenylalanine--tRNA ligase subunit beta [Legionella sp.]